LRRRLAALGVWVTDAQYIREGSAFLLLISQDQQRVMRPGTARAFASRPEDARWRLDRSKGGSGRALACPVRAGRGGCTNEFYHSFESGASDHYRFRRDAVPEHLAGDRSGKAGLLCVVHRVPAIFSPMAEDAHAAIKTVGEARIKAYLFNVTV